MRHPPASSPTEMIGRRRFLKESGAALFLGLASTHQPVSAGTVHFRRGSEAEPETLDPQKSSTLVESHILRDLFEGLLIQDGAGELRPGAAESWTLSPDGLAYTFMLRPDGRWSNGDPVVAEDFVAGFRRLVDPETSAEYSNLLYCVRNGEDVASGRMPVEALGVTATSERTLEITLAVPTAYFLDLAAHQTTLPVHRASLARFARQFTQAGKLVSNGAYVLADIVPGSHIRLVRNPHYREAANVAIDSVDHVLVKDLAAGVRRFKAGELDFLPDLPADQLGELRRQFGDRLQIAPLQGTISFVFNTAKPPFDNKLVRQALAMAIDREFLAETIAAGTVISAESFVPPGTANTRPTPARPPWASLVLIEREDMARLLLARAGFSERNTLNLSFRYNESDNNKAAAIALADMWQRIGVRTKLISTDARTHFAYLRERGDFDVARLGWVADYNDPQNFLFQLETASPFNVTRWANSEFDGLMRAAASERDEGRRTALLHRAEEMVLDETPLTPIAYYTGRYLVAAKLKGFTPNLRAANATRFLTLAP